MNLREERTNYFLDFKSGKKPVYVISGDPSNPAIPHLTFRKLSGDEIAILAWMDREKAEQWRAENKLTHSCVIELNYSKFIALLGELTPSERKGYTIELI